MGQLDVSVIIPTFNRAQVVGEAIASVIAQNPAPLEIIVVDDGSTDDTKAELMRFGDKITVIHKPNGGAASARNAAIKVAKGEWLAFLDSDDLWLPDRLAIFCRDIAQASTDVVAHLADVTFPGEDSSLFKNGGAVFPKNSAAPIKDPFDAHIPGPLLQASVLRADQVRALGGFCEDLPIHEDTLLFKQLALCGPWLVSGDPVAAYRRVGGDHVALMDWETTRPVPFFRSRVLANTLLLQNDKLKGARRSRISRDQSGAYFQLAAAHARLGEGTAARAALLSSVRSFPRLKTIARAIFAALLGESAYNHILKKRELSLHPTQETGSQGEYSR